MGTSYIFMSVFQAKMHTAQSLMEYDDSDEEKDRDQEEGEKKEPGDTESDEDDYIGLNWWATYSNIKGRPGLRGNLPRVQWLKGSGTVSKGNV